ncbi:hypothetical protein D3C81_1689460 [compost metagenome]
MHGLRSIVEIEWALQLATVTVGPAGGGSELSVRHLAHNNLAALAGAGQSDLADAPLEIADVIGDAALVI